MKINCHLVVSNLCWIAALGIVACRPAAPVQLSFTPSALNESLLTESPTPLSALATPVASPLDTATTMSPTPTSKQATRLPAASVQTEAIEPSPTPQSCGKPSPRRISASPSLSLTVESLENAEYFVANDQQWIRLSRGAFDSGNIHIRVEGQPAFGNLNGDDAIDSVVVLRERHGGTGVTRSIFAVLNQNGKPFQLTSVSLYDRTQVEKVAVEDGDIILNLIVHKPGDGLCCPSQKALWIFRLCGNQLIRIYASVEDR